MAGHRTLAFIFLGDTMPIFPAGITCAASTLYLIPSHTRVEVFVEGIQPMRLIILRFGTMSRIGMVYGLQLGCSV